MSLRSGQGQGHESRTSTQVRKKGWSPPERCQKQSVSGEDHSFLDTRKEENYCGFSRTRLNLKFGLDWELSSGGVFKGWGNLLKLLSLSYGTLPVKTTKGGVGGLGGFM